MRSSPTCIARAGGTSIRSITSATGALRSVHTYSAPSLTADPEHAFFQFGFIASGFEKYGSQEALQQNAIQHLLEVYVKVNADAEEDPKVREDAAAWFKRMEDGDEEALRNWREWRELSIRKYEEEYARLNVRFDEYTGESRVSPKVMATALEQLQEKGLIEENNGALLVNLEKYKLGKTVVRKRGAFASSRSIYLLIVC